MMGSMFQSAGFISFFYPIAIFGYALLEETRPRESFWSLVRVYTIVILCIKFVFNLRLFDDFADSDTFKYWTGFLKIGLRKLET